MLNNLVNRHDVVRLSRKLTGGRAASVLDKLRVSSQERVIRQWSDIDREPTQWWAVPAVRRRWNSMVTGDEEVDFPAWVAERYLSGRSGLRALSLGCGMGGRELRWAELGVFESLDAFDIAPAAVEVASERARAEGLGDAVNFQVRDFSSLDGDERYDVILAEHSLHHLAPMPEVVATIDRLLEPGGLFVVDEFVGPRRFQWTDAQVTEAQAALDRLPERWRRIDGDRVKSTIIRPSRLWMTLTDPSEAIDSARITSALHDRFDVLEERTYGGAVLHLLLSDIAQNFLEDEPDTLALLEEAFAAEDRAMAGGLGSDFATFVCRTRRTQ